MKIDKVSKCGTLESNDIFIILSPGKDGIEIELQSVVQKQFGTHIKKVIEEKIKELGITSAVIKVEDKGALDYTIKARLETAVFRAMGC